ncbi:unnamed protein product [Gadus morhua 'NCC']
MFVKYSAVSKHPAGSCEVVQGSVPDGVGPPSSTRPLHPGWQRGSGLQPQGLDAVAVALPRMAAVAAAATLVVEAVGVWRR